MKKKILFVINTLGGAGAEMALLELLEKLEKEIEKTDKQLSPSVVPITGVSGNNGFGTAALKAAVEKAVGSDIIFNR